MFLRLNLSNFLLMPGRFFSYPALFRIFIKACVLLAGTVLANAQSVQEEPRRPVEGIMDNSFLIEEAYNQDPGVVQSDVVDGGLRGQRGVIG